MTITAYPQVSGHRCAMTATEQAFYYAWMPLDCLTGAGLPNSCRIIGDGIDDSSSVGFIGQPGSMVKADIVAGTIAQPGDEETFSALVYSIGQRLLQINNLRPADNTNAETYYGTHPTFGAMTAPKASYNVYPSSLITSEGFIAAGLVNATPPFYTTRYSEGAFASNDQGAPHSLTGALNLRHYDIDFINPTFHGIVLQESVLNILSGGVRAIYENGGVEARLRTSTAHLTASGTIHERTYGLPRIVLFQSGRLYLAQQASFIDTFSDPPGLDIDGFRSESAEHMKFSAWGSMSGWQDVTDFPDITDGDIDFSESAPPVLMGIGCIMDLKYGQSHELNTRLYEIPLWPYWIDIVYRVTDADVQRAYDAMIADAV